MERDKRRKRVNDSKHLFQKERMTSIQHPHHNPFIFINEKVFVLMIVIITENSFWAGATLTSEMIRTLMMRIMMKGKAKENDLLFIQVKRRDVELMPPDSDG